VAGKITEKQAREQVVATRANNAIPAKHRGENQFTSGCVHKNVNTSSSRGSTNAATLTSRIARDAQTDPQVAQVYADMKAGKANGPTWQKSDRPRDWEKCASYCV